MRNVRLVIPIPAIDSPWAPFSALQAAAKAALVLNHSMLRVLRSGIVLSLLRFHWIHWNPFASQSDAGAPTSPTDLDSCWRELYSVRKSFAMRTSRNNQARWSWTDSIRFSAASLRFLRTSSSSPNKPDIAENAIWLIFHWIVFLYFFTRKWWKSLFPLSVGNKDAKNKT